jgi:phosphohistidine phosphatase
MKKLILVRHAKSSWNDITQSDFERPLNDRGHKDAPKMAKRLRKKDIEPDAFISSPAVRALTTAKYFAEEFGVKEKHIIEVPELYHASIQTFLDVVANIDDEHKTAIIFSHNPTITEFANTLTNTRIDDMPTCAMYAVTADIKSWKEFKDAEKEFWFFDYPKNDQ